MNLHHELLKKWREELGMTQDQLGQILNLKQNTISQWESGSRMPDLKSILTLAKIHHRSVEQILRESHPFITIDGVDLAIDSERDIPRLLAEQAWFRYVEQFRAKTESAGESFSSKELQECLEIIRESKDSSEQVLNLESLPRSVYENICQSAGYYVERCLEMMERIEQLEALPEEEKEEQAVILHQMGRTSSYFKEEFSLSRMASIELKSDLDGDADPSEDPATEEETVSDASSAEDEDATGDCVDDPVAVTVAVEDVVYPEEFIAADDDTPYKEA